MLRPPWLQRTEDYQNRALPARLKLNVLIKVSPILTLQFGLTLYKNYKISRANRGEALSRLAARGRRTPVRRRRAPQGGGGLQSAVVARRKGEADSRPPSSRAAGERRTPVRRHFNRRSGDRLPPGIRYFISTFTLKNRHPAASRSLSSVTSVQSSAGSSVFLPSVR